MDKMLEAISKLDTRDIVALVALIVSVIALLVSALQRRRERVEAVIQGLRGDRKSVTYAAMTIRLSKLLRRREHRRSLIASLLLAWNFETSDRARAAVLAALVAARRDYPSDYESVVADLAERFESYETVTKGDINRGRTRLNDVKAAVNQASGVMARTP